ncbi:MAG: glycosyl hydrolase-related protein, partial [Verrucomicrobia bacterium]|nr:glycosyl hydrolase-related protein [Verrucomicrobiota bacterium]
GPVRGVVTVVRRIGKSRVTQRITLAAQSDRLDFESIIEWGDEKEVLLKVAFPVAIRSQTARYDIQFGNLERPTHWNMPQDFARFEVCGQKWADLSEGDVGVALLNDCKYGYDVRDNVMRLTLLRAPQQPDSTADVNKTHHVTFSLYPHRGDFQNGVVREGYNLNVPMLAVAEASHTGVLPASHSSFKVTGNNIVVDTVKKAEDDRDVIVRMYESHGCRGQRTFQTTLPVESVWICDLMENPERQLPFAKGRVRLTFTPYQIQSIKLRLKS